MGPKLVVAVRTDLRLGQGKVAAQVGHAAVHAALASKAKRPREFEAWLDAGQPKVVVKVPSLKALTELISDASRRGVPVHLIKDAGRTQIAPGTVTCCGFGPADEAEVDAVTGHLKLL